MRKLALVLALVCVGVLNAHAQGIPLDTSRKFTFTDCASGGSASQNVKAGRYLFRVGDADVFVCYASTCAAGGEFFSSGAMVHLNVVTTTDMSCRSSGSNADVYLTATGG